MPATHLDFSPHAPDPRFKGLRQRDLLPKVADAARTLGWLVYHTYDSHRSEPSFPDLVLVKPPYVLFVDIKTEVGELSQEQVLWLQRLDNCTHPPIALLWRPSDLPAAFEALHHPDRFTTVRPLKPRSARLPARPAHVDG